VISMMYFGLLTCISTSFKLQKMLWLKLNFLATAFL